MTEYFISAECQSITRYRSIYYSITKFYGYFCCKIISVYKCNSILVSFKKKAEPEIAKCFIITFLLATEIFNWPEWKVQCEPPTMDSHVKLTWDVLKITCSYLKKL